MTHPSSTELYDALTGRGDVAAVMAHLDECIACRVWSGRLAHSAQFASPDAEVFELLARSSQVITGLDSVSDAVSEAVPREGELWRVGQDEAVLVWVRKNFEDGAVDSIPVVLDVEFADEQSVLVPAEQSPLSVELAAMASLRTHIHLGAFINRIGVVDLAPQIEEVIRATREGRPPELPVGARIASDDDDRLEYRQALRDVLAALAPSAWRQEGLHNTAVGPFTTSSDQGEEAMRAAVSERLWGSDCLILDRVRAPFGNGQRIYSLFKVVYLDTSVVVGVVDSIDQAHSVVSSLAAACETLALSSPEADAVCVAEPALDWPCLLFTRASMRHALQVPSGVDVEPQPVLAGLGLVDTLWKHLEGAAPAWEATEMASRGFGSVDLAEVALRHARSSIALTEGKGRRAHQPAKKATWSTLPGDLGDRVARFVAAAVDPSSVSGALDEFRSGRRQ